MKEARFFLVVRFLDRPGRRGAGDALEGGHMTEVLHQPGFLWVRRLRIAEPDATGWSAHAMIYGIDARTSYERYMADQALHERFAGDVDFAL